MNENISGVSGHGESYNSFAEQYAGPNQTHHKIDADLSTGLLIGGAILAASACTSLLPILSNSETVRSQILPDDSNSISLSGSDIAGIRLGSQMQFKLPPVQDFPPYENIVTTLDQAGKHLNQSIECKKFEGQNEIRVCNLGDYTVSTVRLNTYGSPITAIRDLSRNNYIYRPAGIFFASGNNRYTEPVSGGHNVKVFLDPTGLVYNADGSRDFYSESHTYPDKTGKFRLPYGFTFSIDGGNIVGVNGQVLPLPLTESPQGQDVDASMYIVEYLHKNGTKFAFVYVNTGDNTVRNYFQPNSSSDDGLSQVWMFPYDLQTLEGEPADYGEQDSKIVPLSFYGQDDWAEKSDREMSDALNALNAVHHNQVRDGWTRLDKQIENSDSNQ